MPDEQPGVGRQRLSRGLVSAAGQVPGYALARASGLNPVQAGLQGLSGIITSKILGPSAALTGVFFGVLKAVTAVVRQTDLLAKGIERAGNVERIESAFTTLLRSASRAREEMKKLVDLSAPSAFGFEGVAEASRTLQVLTKGAYAGTAALKQIMDVAAATNTPLEDAAFWIGKLFDSLQHGRSVDRLLFQLQNTGLVTGELANQLELLEAQGASFDQKWAAVNKQLSRTKGAADAEAKSLSGLRQQIVNAGTALELAFGQPFLEQQKSGIEATLHLYRAFTPVIQTLGEQAAEVTGLWTGMVNAVKNRAARFEESTGVVKGLTNVVIGLGEALAVIGATRVVGLLSKGLGALVAGGAARRAAVSGFATGTLTNPAAIAARASSLKSMEAAGGAGATAGKLIREGAIFGAGASAAEAGIAKLTAAAMREKAIAFELSAKSGKVATVAAAGLAGGLRGLLGMIVRFGSNALRGIFNIGPIGATIAAVALVAEKIYATHKAAKALAAENKKLEEAFADTAKAMREQIAAIATMTDFTDALAVSTGNVRAAEEKLSNFRAQDKGKGDRATRKILEKGLETAKEQRESVIQRRVAGSLLDTPEQAKERAGERIERRDIAFRGAFEATDEPGKLQLLRQLQAEKEAAAKQGELFRTPEPGKIAEQFLRNDVATGDAVAERDRLEQLAKNLEDESTRMATREGIRDKLRSPGLSEPERTELSDLSGREDALRGQLTLSGSRAAQEADPNFDAAKVAAQLARLSDLRRREAGTKEPTRSQVDDEIQRKMGERVKVEAEIVRLAEERAQLERQSTNPLTRLNREFEDLTKQIDQTPEAERAPLQARQKQIQAQIFDQQSIKERAGDNASEAAAIGASDIPQHEIAARNQQTQQRLTDIGLETERKILATRLTGVAAEQERLAIEKEGAQQELEALQERLAQETNPAQRQEIQNQIGAKGLQITGVDRQLQGSKIQQQDFQREQSENLQVSQRFAAGDKKGAQALQDKFEVEARARTNVVEGGMTPEAATKAAMESFSADTRAAAVQQGPKIVADSLQAAGGGGGVGASDPVLAANARIVAEQAKTNEILTNIQAWFDANQPPPDIKGNP